MSYQLKTITDDSGRNTALHIFSASNPATAILLIHGSIENSGIFYSRSGKGLAPWLDAQGYAVYVPDLRGRGESKPPVSRRSTQTQTGLLRHEISFYFNSVSQSNPSIPVWADAHSWRGVLLLSWLAYTAFLQPSAACFSLAPGAEYGCKTGAGGWVPI